SGQVGLERQAVRALVDVDRWRRRLADLLDGLGSGLRSARLDRLRPDSHPNPRILPAHGHRDSRAPLGSPLPTRDLAPTARSARVKLTHPCCPTTRAPRISLSSHPPTGLRGPISLRRRRSP